ncbi:MAG: CHAP domain-containing protein [Ruminococcus sp.]|nr:CHAP domain-containing protein [Ruminococcus sp.]
MNKVVTRKIPAVFIAVAMLFISVFSISAVRASAASFSPRLEAPSYSNSYYYSDKNIYYKYGYGMPNCTAYAFGRAYELLGYEPNLCHFSAEQWYGYNISNDYYKYGQTPKLGAVACWSYNGGGHVAVVEKIENGVITFSNSGWGYKEFYITTADINDPHAGVSYWNFQGYIYIGDFGSGSDTPTVPTEYKNGVYKTNVIDSLNFRSGAGTSYSSLGYIGGGVQLKVSNVVENGGYHWGYTNYNGKNGWVALEYCIKIADEQPTDPVGYELGDVNRDGVISVNDATEVQKYLVELADFDNQQIMLADINQDGVVSVFDVTMIQGKLVGLY